MNANDLPTPALVADGPAIERNLERMATALPGPRLRPHVKAHKCTALARRQAAHGHTTFTCATVREVIGMAAADPGWDLLLANEILDARPLTSLADRVTIAVDSRETIDAAATAGLRRALIDVNVGLPRCGCPPDQAGALAALARDRGIEVLGVMGYEGHVVGQVDEDTRRTETARSMALLREAHEAVGGEVVSAGGTGTYAVNEIATEIQAGSYVLMDTAYAQLGLPFEPAMWVLGTIISRGPGFWVADVGLKALGMDHGNPTIDGAKVWFCSDEHVTFAALPDQPDPFGIGQKIRVWPAHVDPTVAYHERLRLTDGERVIDEWAIDLRGW